MIKWLHHLFNPHCEHCVSEIEQNHRCKSCEVLTLELEKTQREKEYLLKKLLEKPEPVEVELPKEMKDIQPRRISWPQRRAMLESESREALRIKQDKIKELENITGIPASEENTSAS